MKFELELPIRFHCRDCGHLERSEELYSYPVHCPECGGTNTQQRFKKLPTNRIWRDSEPHKYNLLADGAHDIQFYLSTFNGETCGFSIDEEYASEVDEYDDPIEELEALIEIMKNRYLYNGNITKAEEFLALMKEHALESDLNQHVNKREQLLVSICKLKKELHNTDLTLDEIREQILEKE